MYARTGGLGTGANYKKEKAKHPHQIKADCVIILTAMKQHHCWPKNLKAKLLSISTVHKSSGIFSMLYKAKHGRNLVIIRLR